MSTDLEPYPPVTDELLREVVRRLLTVGSPSKIILFGSHARGDAHPQSDLDLLVIEESNRPAYQRSLPYARALADVYPAKDVVVWTPGEVADWANVANFFVTTAVREGRVLYEN